MAWRTDLPDWGDGGPIELLMIDGSVIKGDLWLETLNINEGEYPNPVINLPGGGNVSFWTAEAWRPAERNAKVLRRGWFRWRFYSL